jgi:hypothetical protein
VNDDGGQKGQGGGFTLSTPAPPVALPSPKSQEMVLVRRSEIGTLKRGVKRAFENPVESAYAWASVWLGVGVTAAFSLAALLSVEGGSKVSAGVISAHAAAAAAALFLAGFLGWYVKKSRASRKTAHDDLITDLHVLSERAPTRIDEGGHPTAGTVEQG